MGCRYFFAAGEKEIKATLRRADHLGVLPHRRERALDFGCGVGWLTQALSGHFARVDGVDIARALLREARRHDRSGGRCHYHLNTARHLRRFPDGSFDIVYANLVLQHMEPADALPYVAELVRGVAPGGLLVFQLPRRVPDRPDEAIPLPPGRRRTRRPVALSNAACRARFVPDTRTLRATAGETVAVDARVENVGSSIWPYRGAPDGRWGIGLGAAWVDLVSGGRRPDGGRSVLPYDLAPGAAVSLTLTLRAPSGAGQYMVELDMVQEGVCWFGEKGSSPAQLVCEVEGEDEETGSSTAPTQPPDAESSAAPSGHAWRRWLAASRVGDGVRACRRHLGWWRAQRGQRPGGRAIMEMHSVPEEEVRPLISRHGRHLAAIDRWTDEKGIESSRYWVTRSQGASVEKTHQGL